MRIINIAKKKTSRQDVLIAKVFDENSDMRREVHIA